MARKGNPISIDKLKHSIRKGFNRFVSTRREGSRFFLYLLDSFFFLWNFHRLGYSSGAGNYIIASYYIHSSSYMLYTYYEVLTYNICTTIQDYYMEIQKE